MEIHKSEKAKKKMLGGKKLFNFIAQSKINISECFSARLQILLHLLTQRLVAIFGYQNIAQDISMT